MRKTQYMLDNEWGKARERLQAIELIEDPGTSACLETIGVVRGWHCLEIGGGSIAAWLCHWVGPTGSVVATDIITDSSMPSTSPPGRGESTRSSQTIWRLRHLISYTRGTSSFICLSER